MAAEKETVMKNKMRAGKHESAHDDRPFQKDEAATPPKGRLHSPTREQIRQRAHEIHKARGGGPGQELDDWLQAEREFVAEQERAVGSGKRSGADGDGGKPPSLP